MRQFRPAGAVDACNLDLSFALFYLALLKVLRLRVLDVYYTWLIPCQ